MRFNILLFVSTCVAFRQTVFTLLDFISRTDFDTWINQQSSIAYRGMLANIGGSSTNTHDIVPGAVLASPSKHDPDYFYQWTRDAALTVRMLTEHLYDTDLADKETKHLVELYISNSYTLQRLDNLSGSFNDKRRSGLGEPKFQVNSTAFNGHWGRPQSDGPALRVSTIIQYLNLFMENESAFTLPDLGSPLHVYQQIIKPDLEYVILNWDREGFDLWEEVNGHHFYTSIVQLRSLHDGTILARKFGDNGFADVLLSTFEKIKQFLLVDAGYIGKSHLLETPSLVQEGKRSGLDAALLLGVLHSHNLARGNYSAIPFDVDDSLVLQTLTSFVNAMKNLYALNKNFKAEGVGAALGRYPEDIYNGHGTSSGNPWFLCTASASEIIYKLIYKLYSSKDNIIVDDGNKHFYQQFSTDPLNGTIEFGTDQFKLITAKIMNCSDTFLQIIQAHVDDHGNMSEQFNREHGFMQGAENLTWSYSAVWNAIRWRFKAISYLE